MPQNHFFLPELDANIPVPKENAHWFNNEKKIILGISDGIVIDEQMLTKGVSSIPDIWARPLLFQSAMRSNSRHPLRRKCIQEWRGLLSLLALHKVKPELSGLEIIPIHLNNETFSTALRNLSPRPIQLEKGQSYEWTDVLMISFNGVAVGAFSPATLVYTGVDYSHRLKNMAFSFKDKDGFLAPPENKEDGLEYLGEWLYHLQKKLIPLFYADQSNPDSAIISTINELLTDWLDEIREKLGLNENVSIDVKTHKVAEDPIEVKGVATYLADYKVYERLLHPLRRDETVKAEGMISDILLQSSRKTDLRVVLITEKIISEQVNIWNGLIPKSLGENPRAIISAFFNAPSGQKINGIDIGSDNGLWVRPELYFLSPTLLKAKTGHMLNEAEEELNINTKYVLPFKKEILTFFSAKEIKEKLNPFFKDEGSTVKFSFTLPMEGRPGYKVERTYKTKVNQSEEGEIVEIDVPIVEIFPDYLGENWRRYYLFSGKAEHFHMQPIVEGQIAATQERERHLKYDHVSERVKISQLSGDNCFPEAIAINSDTDAPLGLFLIDRKGSSQGLKHSWTVGIDFGTSNTNVYKNRGTADTAERWSYNFPDYYRSITQSDPEIRNHALEEYFFPTRKVNLPIPSTLKIYNLAKRDTMMLDYFIYYPLAYKFPDNVLSDIKWDDAGERKTEYFLESLLFLLLIEVVRENVNEVMLACSYPKAFSATNIQVFQKEWENVFAKLLKHDDPVQNYRVLDIHREIADNEIKIRIKQPIFKTEGIAAGEYFASEVTIKNIGEVANKEIAAICLDVGGGTTDISIWYLNNIAFDASVLLAGRQLASILQTNNRIAELLFTKEAAIALEEKRSEPGYFSARLNLILKNEEERVQEMLVKHANNKDIQQLRQIIALEFGALSFYAAQVCISTNEQVGGLLTRISNDGIKLHWGGNAAKLINWIDFGKYNKQGIASKILNAAFFNCLNDKSALPEPIKAKALEQLQSPGYKSEASGGLVVMRLDENNVISGSADDTYDSDFEMPDGDANIHQFYAGSVCGENIELIDRSISFHMPISNKDLFDEGNRTKFKTTSLDRLIRFVDILNFFGIKSGLFNEDTKIVLGETEKRIIRDGVLKQYIRMQSLKESQRLIEPVFIMEIKLLLEIIKSKMV